MKNTGFLIIRILSILTHTHGENGECLKEIDCGIYPKGLTLIYTVVLN